MRHGIIIYPEYRDSLNKLTDREFRVLIEAMFSRHEGETVENIDKHKALVALWPLFEHSVDSNKESFEKIRSINSEKGKKGGRGNKAAESRESRSFKLKPKKPTEQNRTEQNRTEQELPFPHTPCSASFEDWFENVFWKAYPKKTAKPKALKAAMAALKRTDRETVMETLQISKTRDTRFLEAKFTPYPASWLNSDPWNDEDTIKINPGGYDEAGPKPERTMGLLD